MMKSNDRSYRFKVLTLVFLTGVTAACSPKHELNGNAEDSDFGLSTRFASPKCENKSVRGSAQESLRRLTKTELKNTLSYLVGSAVINNLEAAFALLPDEAPLRTLDDVKPLHTTGFATGYSDLINQMAAQISSSPTLRSSLGGDCLGTNDANNACLTSFVSDFARKAWRRPASATEVSNLLNMPGIASLEDKIYGIISRVLLSPDTVFLITAGTGTASKNGVRLTPHEVAARISYLTTYEPPDAALMAAADQNALQTLEEVETQVRRLLETSAAKNRMKNFFSDWLHLYRVVQPPANVGAWAHVSVQGIESEMRQEVLDFVDYQVWRKKGTYRDLMSAPEAFPATSRMAQLYGTTVTDASSPSTSANHQGLLMRVGLLNSGLDKTNAIRRGVYLLRDLLCYEIPSPSSKIVNQRQTDVGSLDPLEHSGVEIVKHVTSPVTCQGCHSTIDPVGFAFEWYDPLGRPRTQQQVLNQDGSIAKEFSLPTAPFYVPIDGEQRAVASVSEIVSEISESQAGRACLARKLQFHIKRRSLTAADDCSVSDTYEILKSQTTFEALVKSIANEDIFWRKQ